MRRLRSVEGARGLAAISVLTYHIALRGGHGWIASVTSRGWLGVPLFFLLSAFLLFQPFAQALVHGGPWPSVGRYAKSRLLRIFPAYWLALSASIVFEIQYMRPFVLYAAAVTAWVWCWWSRRRPWPAIALTAVAAPLLLTDSSWYDTTFTHTFTYNGISNFLLVWIPFGRFTLMGVSWTLCIEISFYLVLPLFAGVLAFATRRLRDARIRAAVVALPLVCSPALSWWFVGDVGLADPLRLWLPAFADEFAIGMLLVLALQFVSEISAAAARALLAASVALAAVANVLLFHVGETAPYARGGGMVYVRAMELSFAFALASVLLRHERTLLGRLLASRPLVSVGTISYGVYLWHPFLADELEHTGLWGAAWSNILIVAAGTFAAASVSWFVVERPLLRLKDRARVAAPRIETAVVDQAAA